MHDDVVFLKRAIDLARMNVKMGKGGPFGAIIVKEGQVIAEGTNLVTSLNDPTAHAEIVAIRRATEKLKSFQLTGCTIYCSCEPCPMCLGAIYWARPDRIVFAATRKDAASAGFDDDFIYRELITSYQDRKIPTQHIQVDDYMIPFDEWNAYPNKIPY
ncbi:MAG: nucleoside deaminase [Bacteroidales bacterium]|nr:nucleoside deaminase [Bacteroidales bacterium]